MTSIRTDKFTHAVDVEVKTKDALHEHFARLQDGVHGE